MGPAGCDDAHTMVPMTVGAHNHVVHALGTIQEARRARWLPSTDRLNMA